MGFVEQYRTLRNLGRSRDEALAELRRVGASPIDCVKAIHEVEHVGLVAAKRIFSESRVGQPTFGRTTMRC